MTEGPADDGDPGGPVAAPVDVAAVVAELEADVARRRAAGTLPAGLEAELDELARRHAPPHATGVDLDELLARAEAASQIDVDVPTASGLPGGAQVKRSLRAAMAWFVRYVAEQVTASSQATVAALGEVVRRLERVEAAAPDAGWADRPPPPAVADGGAWAGAVVDALGPPAAARVCVADAGDGAVLAALVAAGHAAYGVDADAARAERLLGDGLEVRPDAALDHLARLAPGVLGACVLAGGPEHLPRGARLTLLDRALATLVPGGRLVVLSASPAGWAATAPRVVHDLAPAPPFHAETWAALLADRGVVDVVVRDRSVGSDGDAAGYLLVARRP